MMNKVHWLAVACGLALLAAGPAVAQSSPGDSGATTPAPHAAHQSMHAARGGQSATAQDAEVDRLNDQSYQAAQQGRTFSAGTTSGAGTNSSQPAGGRM